MAPRDEWPESQYRKGSKSKAREMAQPDERHILLKLGGDAHREPNDPKALAKEILDWHWDIARCYCRACVIARALITTEAELYVARAKLYRYEHTSGMAEIDALEKKLAEEREQARQDRVEKELEKSELADELAEARKELRAITEPTTAIGALRVALFRAKEAEAELVEARDATQEWKRLHYDARTELIKERKKWWELYHQFTAASIKNDKRIVRLEAKLAESRRALREYETRLGIARSLIPANQNQTYLERTGQALYGGGECICPRFSDLPEGTIIADLTCPIHGVEGTDPGDVIPGSGE